VFRLNWEDLGRQGSFSCKEDIGLRLRREMQQILLVTMHNCKEFLQQRSVSHVNLIMGCVMGKLRANGAALVCTVQWNLHLRFLSLQCPNALLPEDT
jgi:hypothetical protein